MNACIIAVGTELLTPFRVDTNSLFITERLNEIGVDVRLKMVAGDDAAEVADLFRRALTWADVIVVTGGLGPTEDDVTRDSLARALDVPLDVDESIVERIRDRFARRGMTMPEINRRQAMVPRGAIVLANPNGTAPGLWVEQGRSAIVLLPGPPREMKPMFEAAIRERLRARSGGAGLSTGAAHHGSYRVGRRLPRAAGVQPVAGAIDPDQHHDSRGPRSNRAAPDGQRCQSGGRRRRARRGSPGTARRAWRFDL